MIISSRDLTLIALLTSILFIQEQILSFIPNITLTVLLLVLYSKTVGLYKTAFIIFCHTILDSAINGFNIIFFPFMLIGRLIIPLTLCTLFKKIKSNILLAILGFVYSLIYCWLFIIPNVIFYEINVLSYFIADILFELILAFSSFVLILILYNPLFKVFKKFINKA